MSLGVNISFIYFRQKSLTVLNINVMVSNPVKQKIQKKQEFSILLFVCDVLYKTKTPNKFGEFLWI